MRVVIGYPPLKPKKGHSTALLSQNRQFQWFSSPTYVYPVIPASAATLLKANGHDVFWLDGIAENWTYDQWLKKFIAVKPDLLFIETKTPVVKLHWRIIKDLKHKVRNLKVVLAGDHVTALPKESLKNSPVDHIISGGNYDVSLLNIANSISKGSATSEKFGTSRVIHSPTHLDLNTLPFIDRSLTKWHLYAYKNGNFKYLPGTYTMAGRDCWWRKNGGCTFCSWTTLYPQFSVRSPENLLDEIGQLIKLGVKEVFDDTGTFMAGDWLEKFCKGLIKRGYHQKIYFGCNLRFGVLTKKQYTLMAKANFRFLLYGLESVNPKTIKRLNKGTDPTKVEAELKLIHQVNQETNGSLEPHVTCMVGYPWETLKDAQNTVNFTKNLFKNSLIDSLQATICIPYPGTKLFRQSKKNSWLRTSRWERFDMGEPIMKTKIKNQNLLKLTRNIYTSCLTPQYILKKLFSIRNLDDLKWFTNAGVKVIAHYLDFS
jgi:anaerobic magnesium-protoporphyrin IX monomethyl ester cyclase